MAAEQPALVEEMDAFAQVIIGSARGSRINAPVIDTSLVEDAIRELRQLGYIK